MRLIRFLKRFKNQYRIHHLILADPPWHYNARHWASVWQIAKIAWIQSRKTAIPEVRLPKPIPLEEDVMREIKGVLKLKKKAGNYKITKAQQDKWDKEYVEAEKEFDRS